MTTIRNTSSTAPRAGRPEWLVPAGLIALSAIPMLAGMVRLIGLSSGQTITADNARFFESPMPVVIHIIASTLFSILGAFQFAPGFRRRRPAWHRVAGRVLMVCGLASALSGVWMTQFYPLPPQLQGILLYGFRLVIGLGMALAIVASLAAILRGDVAQHRAWMLRGYAIGLGAGTQAAIMLPPALLIGEIHGLPRDLLMILAWLINLAVAESAIRRRAARPDRQALARAA